MSASDLESASSVSVPEILKRTRRPPDPVFGPDSSDDSAKENESRRQQTNISHGNTRRAPTRRSRVSNGFSTDETNSDDGAGVVAVAEIPPTPPREVLVQVQQQNETINDDAMEDEDDADDEASTSEEGENATSSPSKPGNKKKRRRAKFTTRQKLSYVRRVERLMKTGVSQTQACKFTNIPACSFRKWRKCKDLLASTRPGAFTTSVGKASFLRCVEKELLMFIFELREQGIAVNVNLICLEVCRLAEEHKDDAAYRGIHSFQNKTKNAKCKCVSRWVKKHGYTYRMGTHVSQKSPAETAELSTDFLEVIRPLISQPNRHKDFIINMDQTPVFFSMESPKTLAAVGARTINVRSSNNDTKRATLAVTVTASGKLLPGTLVFKGKPEARIATQELPTFPSEGMFYKCQLKAWMDERVMVEWVDEVLEPYLATAPPGVVPVLFLDSYRCHMMASVVGRIQNLGCEVEHIPGGCTGNTQPVDVGINRPFKCSVRAEWEQWMLGEMRENGCIRAPTRRLIAEWCIASGKKLTTDTIRNSWLHREFTWFLPGCDCRPGV